MDQDAILSTAAGDVWLSPALMAVAPPDVALLGIRELHFAALGDTEYPYETDAFSLLPDEARAMYASSVTGLLGQLTSVTPDAADRILGSMCEHADRYGGFDGLEGPALTALLTGAEGGRVGAAHQDLQWMLGQYGLPDISGGGYQTSVVVDRASRCLGFPEIGHVRDTVQQVTDSGGSTRSLVDAGTRLAGEGVGAVLGHEAQSTFNHAARELGTVAGATVLGAEIGSALGPAGTFFGAVAGFFVGLFTNDSAHQHDQRVDAAKDVAHGVQLVVDGHRKVEVNGTPQVAGNDGQCKPAPAGAHGPQHPPQNVVLEPSHHKCDVGEDVVLPRDFKQPYWGDSVTLIGSAATTGGGLDATFSTWQALNGGLAYQLADIPLMDEAGLMYDGGLVLAAVYEELRAAEPELHVEENPWAEATQRLTRHHSKRVNTRVDVAQVATRLRHLEVRPQDQVGLVLRRLRRIHGL